MVEGDFDVGGKLPKVESNTKLHKGWFDQSLPRWLDAHPDKIAFVHIDCDLYSSTKTVFDLLKDRFQPGTVIVFDEYFNYPGWRKHEFKAFQEFIAENGVSYSYLAYAKYNVAVRLDSIGGT
jgi:predicted O-methyltransferase YrrM